MVKVKNTKLLPIYIIIIILLLSIIFLIFNIFQSTPYLSEKEYIQKTDTLEEVKILRSLYSDIVQVEQNDGGGPLPRIGYEVKKDKTLLMDITLYGKNLDKHFTEIYCVKIGKRNIYNIIFNRVITFDKKSYIENEKCFK